MKYIPLFKHFLNESYERPLYRTTSIDFLKNLLKNKKIKSKGKHFVSVSFDVNSGGQDNYGDLTIKFDSEILFNQGAIEIYYDDPDFWEENPKITRHVTGYENEEDYYDGIGYENAEEANDNYELDWDSFCQDFASEEEVVIHEIKYIDGLITGIKNKKMKDFISLEEYLNLNNPELLKYIK